MISILSIDYNNFESLEKFYQIGKSVRRRNKAFELEWTETQNIPDLIEEYNLETQLFIAGSGSSEGRVQAFIFRDDQQQGFIGRYECDNDPELAKALLKAAEQWLKQKGAKKILGPMNGSTWDDYRFNLISDKPLFPSEPYQPLYYLNQWRENGYQEDLLYQTNSSPKNNLQPMSKEVLDGLAKNIGCTVTNLPGDLMGNERQLQHLHEFYQICFQDNPLYRPIPFNRYRDLTAKLMQITDFDHSFIVWDQNQKPVSVLISYRDVYHDLYLTGKIKNEDNKKRTLFLKTISTVPEWRGKHLSRTLANFACVISSSFGYEEVLFATMWIDNSTAQYTRDTYGSDTVRSYALFSKDL